MGRGAFRVLAAIILDENGRQVDFKSSNILLKPLEQQPLRHVEDYTT